MKSALIRRQLSAVSKFYKYGIEYEVIPYSPVEHVQRPKASAETESIGLSPAEVQALIDDPAVRSLLHQALVTLPAHNGLRINEALGADTPANTQSGGHPLVLRITRKRSTRATLPTRRPPPQRSLGDPSQPRGHVIPEPGLTPAS